MSQKYALPKKFDLVHQIVSPRERVGSGDETEHSQSGLTFVQVPHSTLAHKYSLYKLDLLPIKKIKSVRCSSQISHPAITLQKIQSVVQHRKSLPTSAR